MRSWPRSDLGMINQSINLKISWDRCPRNRGCHRSMEHPEEIAGDTDRWSIQNWDAELNLLVWHGRAWLRHTNVRQCNLAPILHWRTQFRSHILGRFGRILPSSCTGYPEIWDQTESWSWYRRPTRDIFLLGLAISASARQLASYFELVSTIGRKRLNVLHLQLI